MCIKTVRVNLIPPSQSHGHMFGFCGWGCEDTLEQLSSRKFWRKWCHFTARAFQGCRHQTCMTEQRLINHLSAVVVSQSYFEASAGDIHHLWLKAGTSMSNVQMSESREENRRRGGRCVQYSMCACGSVWSQGIIYPSPNILICLSDFTSDSMCLT